MAFPTTPVIDSFGRADATLDSSLACSDGVHSWFQGHLSGDVTTGGQITSGQLTNTGTTTVCGSFISASNFGPDVEVYQSYPVAPTSYAFLACRVTNENTAGVAMYAIIWIPGVGWRLRTYGPFVTLASDNANPLSDGDRIGLSAIGTEITAWHYTGGAWVSRLSVTDTTFSNAGKIGFEFQDNTARADDFGGGTYAPPAPPFVVAGAPPVAWKRRSRATSW